MSAHFASRFGLKGSRTRERERERWGGGSLASQILVKTSHCRRHWCTYFACVCDCTESLSRCHLSCSKPVDDQLIKKKRNFSAFSSLHRRIPPPPPLYVHPNLPFARTATLLILERVSTRVVVVVVVVVAQKRLSTYAGAHASSVKPVLNWANVCSPNILRTLRRTLIRVLIELLVRLTWFGQFDELYFVLNWLVMRCKLRSELAADAQQTA